MIQANNIHKSYDKLHVLKGVDFSINSSEIVSIIGKSGSGKSTLLHILGTLDKADKGSVIIDGIDISALDSKEISLFRNSKIGFIFQFHHLLPEFTALENVLIPAMIAKSTGKSKENRAKELLDYLGLTDRMSHKPNQLSGGEQQRVAVARALINDPSVVFADEPTGNLDSESSEELHQLLQKLRKEYNQTFVIVTHSKELSAISDRTIIMQDGLIKSSN
ncbi:MAG: ABC transporter ATP-binding protein [Saprospiraceae bacterium]|nr:ABC transporter ATP-binding protein [Saprospiraceae bacterium]